MKSRFQKKKDIMKRAIKMEMREHRSSFIVYMVLRALVILMMVLQIFNKNYENVFLCLLTLVLFTLPSFVEHRFKIDLPDTLQIIVLFFIFAAEILGEIGSFYTRIPYWDTVLHTVNGFLCSAIGFALVDILNKSPRTSFSLSPLYLAVAAFCFSMTVGVVWEFFEFGMDVFTGSDMQKDTVVTAINSVIFDPDNLNRVVKKPIESVIVNGEDWMAMYGGYIDIGIYDTMKDLFVNFIGAVVFSVIGFFYVKSRGKSRFAERFIPKVKLDSSSPSVIPEEDDMP